MKGAEPRNFEQHREMVQPEFDIRASMPDGKALNLRDVKVADLASMPVKSRAAIGSAIEDLNILDRLGHHDNLLGEIRRLGDDAPRVAVREKAGYVPRSQEVDEYAPNYLGEVDLGEAPALDPKMNVHASDIDKLQADLLQNWDTLPVLTRIGDMFTSALRGLHNLLYIVVGSHQRSSITLSTNATLRDINKLNAKIEKAKLDAPEEDRAALRLQAGARGMAERRELREQRAAATKFQAARRGALGRLEAAHRGARVALENSRDALNEEVDAIFDSVRGGESDLKWEYGKAESALFNKSGAALRAYEGDLAGLRELQAAQAKAYADFGAEWTGRAEAYAKERHDAATEIQKTGRGYIDRQSFLEQRDAAIRLQAGARGMADRSMLREERNAAAKIQAGARGMRDRKELKRQHAAATKIQALGRGVIEGQAAVKKEIENARGVISDRNLELQGTIGDIFGGAYSNTPAHYEFQNAAGGMLANQREELSVLEASGSRNVTDVSQLLVRHQAEIDSLSKEWIIKADAYVHEENAKRDAAAATQIQAMARGVSTREKLANEQDAASKIQRVARGRAGRAEAEKVREVAASQRKALRKALGEARRGMEGDSIFAYHTRGELIKKFNALNEQLERIVSTEDLIVVRDGLAAMQEEMKAESADTGKWLSYGIGGIGDGREANRRKWRYYQAQPGFAVAKGSEKSDGDLDMEQLGKVVAALNAAIE